MAILAVFNNAVALAEEIEARTSALQAIKEGRLPLLPEAAATPTEPPVVPTDAEAVTDVALPVPLVPLVPSAPVPPVSAPTV